MTVKEQIIELRKQGKSYGDIATELGISKETAYRYGKNVKVIAERKETQEIEPTESVKEAFAKGVRKADSRAYMIRLLRDTAERLGYGNIKKNKFVYDDTEYGLRCKQYEKVIDKTKGFILPDYQGILNFIFKDLMRRIDDVDDENVELRNELSEKTGIEFQDEWDYPDYKEVLSKRVKDLEKEVSEYEREYEKLEKTKEKYEDLLREYEVLKKDFSELEAINEDLRNELDKTRKEVENTKSRYEKREKELEKWREGVRKILGEE